MVNRFQISGAVLILIGLAFLVLLRGALFRLLVFVLEFLGILVGFLLIFIGLGMLFGGRWISRQRTYSI
ncbi:MAG: hypothetical protein O7B30_01615 [Thaumarchaeota archaeon]|nr:hypothetical protein [Nitrososphaerota archaeon]